MTAGPVTDEPAVMRLGTWAAGLTVDDLPAPVVARVKTHILDQVGAGLACAEMPWVASVREYALRYGAPGGCTVLGTDRRLDAEGAVLVNSTAGHGFELDDYCSGTFAHPGCVAVPSALAVGEELDATGADVLVAAALAFELIVRLALATMPSMLVERGLHQTPIHGVFGAALAAGRLMGLPAAELGMALSIAGSQAGGTVEYAQTGGEVKRLHAGFGSAGGIRAARLAAAGMTGPPTVLEGKRGVLQAFCADPQPQVLWEGLGETWHLADYLSIKPYCCAASIHPAIDGVRHLMAEHGLRPEDVDILRVGLSRHALLHVGSTGPAPRDMTGAQFSAHFSLALSVVAGGNGIDEYLAAQEAGFADPLTLDVARRVELHFDEEVEEELPRGYLGKIALHTKDGVELAHRSYARGSVMNPLSADEVDAKFLNNAERAVGAEPAAELLALLGHLEELPGAAGVLALLGAKVDHAHRDVDVGEGPGGRHPISAARPR
jgi:2-methylcitrate dehydratase PrpD